MIQCFDDECTFHVPLFVCIYMCTLKKEEKRFGLGEEEMPLMREAARRPKRLQYIQSHCTSFIPSFYIYKRTKHCPH